MRKYEVRANSGWNWNVRSPWVVVDVFAGTVVGVEAYYATRKDAETALRDMRLE